MSEHTPGPWTQHGVAISKHVDTQSAYTLALCQDHGRWGVVPEAEAWANARLIAAAPDLLAALKGLLAGLGGDFDMALARQKADARAAIAKAS